MKFFIFLLLLFTNVYANICLIPKVAIVTNVDNNIGSLISTSLSKKGYDLILTHNNNSNNIDKLTKNLVSKYYNNIKIIKGNLEDCLVVDNIFETYQLYFANTHDLDILILNPPIMEYNIDLYNINDFLNVFSDIYFKIYDKTILYMNKNSANRGTIVSVLYKNLFNDIYFDNNYINKIKPFKYILEYVIKLNNFRCLTNYINSNIIICNYICDSNYKIFNEFTGSYNHNKYNLLTYNDLLSIIDFLCSESGRFINGLTIDINN
tara:strand:- start:9944 stop:10735 length:792 start_codon:yes stop_codon:yes gene_type:complete